MGDQMRDTKNLHFVCKGCPSRLNGACKDGSCLPFVTEERRKEILTQPMSEEYDGARFTSDAMDCALPIALDSHSGCNFGCVAEGMKIMMGDGTMKPIEEIKPGDVVLSYDEGMNPRPSVVTRLSKNYADNIMSISSGTSKRVRLTQNHGVRIQGGYKFAGCLDPSEDLVYRVWKCEMSEKDKKDASIRMQNFNPMQDPEIAKSTGLKIRESWTLEKRQKRSRLVKGRNLRTSPISDEEKKAASERMLSNNPMKNPTIAKRVSEKIKEAFASGKRKSPHLCRYGMGNYSNGQQMLYEILDSMGTKYQKEFCLTADASCPNKCRIYLDAAIPEEKIAIEYDGFPFHSFKETQKKDKLRDAWLKKKGWKIVRIVGDEIQNKVLVEEKISGICLSNHGHWMKIDSKSDYSARGSDGRLNANSAKKSGWVYDVQTDPHHNFVVGPGNYGGILVHNCLYCFANNLMRAPDRNPDKVKQMLEKGSWYSEWNIKALAKLLNRDAKGSVAKAIYPLLDQGMPVQLGALGDPLDEIERYRGWLLKAIPMFQEQNIPVRIGTKGAKLMMDKRYRDLFHKTADHFWFAFSIISADDDLITQVDISAPNATERFKAMKAYAKEGHPCSVRFRPFLPGLSDRNDGWKRLLDKAADAGAKAVSFEFIFLEAAPTVRQKIMYHHMFKSMGNVKFGEEWNAASKGIESCRRGSREYKLDMTQKVRDYAHNLGMVFACSDPHFKEWNDSGCCCGILPDDPIFGKWSRRQLTNVVYELKQAFERGERMQVTYDDWAPDWAHQIKSVEVFNNGDWHAKRLRKYQTFGDTFRNKWNNPKHPRNPFQYFAGVMRPVGVDKKTNDVIYEYRDWYKGFDQQFSGEIIE